MFGGHAGRLGGSRATDAIEHVRETVGVGLKVGVGRARTAQAAGMAAKHALETCREEDIDVESAD